VANKPRKIIVWPTVTGCQVSKEAEEEPNYVTDDEEEPPIRPAHNTRARKQAREVTQEAMLSVVELSDCAVSPQNLASRKFPMKLLCEIANAIMDESGEMLEYRHLMARPQYRQIWGRSFGNEIGRLTQGMEG